MESHGGYICRYEDVDAAWLVELARGALADDGRDWRDCGLQVTLLGGPRVVRFAFDAPFTYGRLGARWYLTHHSLALRLSQHLGLTVHSYVFDSGDLEQVIGYGNGRRVGGELVRYEDAHMPEEDSELAFERLKAKWPLGHLARVLGVTRDDLIRIPRQPTVLLDLDSPPAPQPLWRLLPQQPAHQSGPWALDVG